MFEFDFEDLPEEAGAHAGSSAAPSIAATTAAPFARGAPARQVAELKLEVATLGGGVVATLALPPSATAERVKERLEKSIGMRATEQRLAIGAQVFEGLERLEAFVPPVGNTVQVALVHVPAARRVVVSGGRDASIRLWDLDHGDSFREVRNQGAVVTCLSAVWSARRALSGGADGALRLWDLESGKVLRELSGHGAGITGLAVDWKWQRAITGDEQGGLLLWDLEHGKTVQQFEGHAASILCAELSMEANCALTGGADHLLRLWVIESGEVFLEFSSFTPANCLSANLTHNPPIGVTGNFAITRFWSLNQWPVQWDFKVHTGAVTSVAVHWESNYVISGGADATIVCGRMDLNSVKIEGQKALRGHSAAVTCLAAVWDRRRVVSGSEDGSLRFWDYERGVCLQELTGHRGGVLCVALELEDVAAASSGQLDADSLEDLMRARRDAGVVEQARVSDDLAAGKSVHASSQQDGLPKCAVDGNSGTAWTSEHADNQWLAVDLGGVYQGLHVEIRWGAAFATAYTLHVSNEGATWYTVAHERGCEGWAVTHLPPAVRARWIRVYCQRQAMKSGFSIRDLKVYGSAF